MKRRLPTLSAINSSYVFLKVLKIFPEKDHKTGREARYVCEMRFQLFRHARSLILLKQGI